MRILLEHFFKNIAGVQDIAVECLDKNLYRCSSPNLKKFSGQKDYYQQCLKSFGLANVITFAERDEDAEFIIDFDPKHIEKIEHASNKFLNTQQHLWLERSLDAYASLIIDDHKVARPKGLATNLLLGFNFNAVAPEEYSYSIEKSEGATILTFDEPKLATVLFVKPHEMKIVSNGFYLNAYLKLATDALLPLFNSQRYSKQSVTVNTKLAAISVNDTTLTRNEIDNILNHASRVTALASSQKVFMLAMQNVLTTSQQLVQQM